MPQFRKKPVVIEAVLFTKIEHDSEGPFPVFDTLPPNWLLEPMEKEDGITWSDDGLHIPTLEGVHLASPGDWIIQGVNGELYPCKPDIFAKTYEVV